MKKLKLLTIMFVLALLATTVQAKGDLVEQGKALFNSPTLAGSTNNKSCNSCHPNGKGLEKSRLTHRALYDQVRRCIAGPMKGTKVLTGRDKEMDQLEAYLLSLRKK